MRGLSAGELPFGAYSVTEIARGMYGVRIVRRRLDGKYVRDDLLSATLPSAGEARAYVAALEAGDPPFSCDAE